MIILLIYHIQSSPLKGEIGRDDRGIRGEEKDQQTKDKEKEREKENKNKNNTRELELYSLRIDNRNDSIKHSKFENNFEEDKRDDKFINSKENESDDDRLGEEEKERRRRRSDCNVQGNNNTFCENSEKTEKKFITRETSKADKFEDKPDYEVYNFKDSGDGKSWLLGTDESSSSSDYANAFEGGYSQCPVDIIVPRSLTSKEGETRPVEVIGRYAYYTCGRPDYGDKTKTVFVTKQIKIIKRNGLGFMYNVESFRIEEGSVLESIEGSGLHGIGFDTGQNDAKKRGTLTLPSTLSSVGINGFFNCNLFKIIIYCGTHSLSNICQLEYNVDEKTKVRVTNQYSANTIFGYDAFKDSPTEVEGNCSQMALKPKPTNIKKDYSCSSLSRVLSSVLLSCFFLIDSDSDYGYDSDFSLQVNREFEVEEKRDSKDKEGRRRIGIGRGVGIRRGSRNLSSLGVETEVFLVITNRKKGHRRGVDENQISQFRKFSKFRLKSNTRFPYWREG